MNAVNNFEISKNQSSSSDSIDEGELNLNNLDSFTFHQNSNCIDQTIEIDESKINKNHLNYHSQQFQDLLNYVNYQNNNNINQNTSSTHQLNVFNPFLTHTARVKILGERLEIKKNICTNIPKLEPKSHSSSILNCHSNSTNRVIQNYIPLNLIRERSCPLINLSNHYSKLKGEIYVNQKIKSLKKNYLTVNKFSNSASKVRDTYYKNQAYLSPLKPDFKERKKDLLMHDDCAQKSNIQNIISKDELQKLKNNISKKIALEKSSKEKLWKSPTSTFNQCLSKSIKGKRSMSGFSFSKDEMYNKNNINIEQMKINEKNVSNLKKRKQILEMVRSSSNFQLKNSKLETIKGNNLRDYSHKLFHSASCEYYKKNQTNCANEENFYQDPRFFKPINNNEDSNRIRSPICNFSSKIMKHSQPHIVIKINNKSTKMNHIINGNKLKNQKIKQCSNQESKVVNGNREILRTDEKMFVQTHSHLFDINKFSLIKSFSPSENKGFSPYNKPNLIEKGKNENEQSNTYTPKVI